MVPIQVNGHGHENTRKLAMSGNDTLDHLMMTVDQLTRSLTAGSLLVMATLSSHLLFATVFNVSLYSVNFSALFRSHLTG